MGNSTKAPNYCFPRRYEMLTKLLDIEERIEQSAVNLEQFRLEDYSDNEDIPDLSWRFVNEWINPGPQIVTHLGSNVEP